MLKIIKDTIVQNKWRMLVTGIFIALNMYLLVIPSKIIGNIIDLLYNIEQNSKQIYTNIFYLLGMSILLLIVRVIWKYYDTYLPRILEKNIRLGLFKQLLCIKVPKLQNMKNGEMMSYFTKDIFEIRICAHHLISFATRIIFTVLFTGFAMIQNVDFRLTLIVMSPMFLTAIAIIKIRYNIDKSYIYSQKNFTKMSEYIQESTDAIRTTKAYHGESKQIEDFIKLGEDVKNSNYKVNFYSSLLSFCINICFGLSFGLAILFGAPLVINNVISVGDFVAFNSYITLFINPICWIPSVFSRYRRGKISYDRLQKIFDIEKEYDTLKLSNKNPNGEIKKFDGNIVIKNLTFNYPDYIDKVLDDINIKIAKGETLGIIGKIGSGKSTLMNLLVRLYPVKNNKIFIDGEDINNIPIEVIRDNVCYITQDNFLFSTTIKDNVSLFKEDFDDEDIKNSITEAMIYDEVMNMPSEMDTKIGERGVELSGGQKQRLVISRAFLNKSSIVIFDDTFSALDNKTEQKVLKNIKRLVKGRTCIIVSNRISDIKHADKIIVLDSGKIAEFGTHSELMELKKLYYEFYKEQAIKQSDSILD